MNAASNPYLNPGTDVLRNVPGLRYAEQLAAFETSKTAQRIYQLEREPLVGSFDARHLKAIHQWVFQDVFPPRSRRREQLRHAGESRETYRVLYSVRDGQTGRAVAVL